MQSFSRQILGGLLAAQKAGIEGTFDYRNFHETTYTDESGTILALPGDVVAYIEDQSGNGNHALQPTLAQRMELAITPPRLLVPAGKRALVTVPTGGWQGHMTIATTSGTATYLVNIPAGSYLIGRNATNFFPAATTGGLIGQSFADRVLSPAEIAEVEAQFVALGAQGDYAGDVRNFWRGRSEITEFPLIPFGAVTSARETWVGCTGLTSFPLLDFSNVGSVFGSWSGCSGLTAFPLLNFANVVNARAAFQFCSGLTSFPLLNFTNVTIAERTWNGCTNLADFPPHFFDGCPCTNFINSFANTNLTVDSINGILVSINSNGTSNGTFNQSGGSAPTLAGQQAIDAMRDRNWNITVTGGY